MIKFKETVDVKKDKALAEIYQNLSTKFAFVDKDNNGVYTNAHPFVQCRDFLGDALLAQKEKKRKSIYGFTFDGKTQHFLEDKTRLVILLPNATTLENTLNNLGMLHELENIVGGICKTKISRIKDNPSMLMVVGSNFWLKSIFNISLYSYLIKCLGYSLNHNQNIFENMLEIPGNNEYKYAKQTYPNIMKILPKLKNVNKKLPSVSGWLKNNNDIYTIHNYSGFVSTIAWHKHTNYLDNNIIYQRVNTILKKN